MTEILLKAALLSILPIAELRGGIPYAYMKGVDPVLAYALCVGVNALAFPIVMLFLNLLHPVFMKVGFYEKLFERFVARTRKKLEKSVEKYGFWALMIFVMIPLPVTGAYTGTFGAWLFGLPKKKAFLAVLLGVMIAGVIVTLVMYFGGPFVKSLFAKEVHV